MFINNLQLQLQLLQQQLLQQQQNSMSQQQQQHLSMPQQQQSLISQPQQLISQQLLPQHGLHQQLLTDSSLQPHQFQLPQICAPAATAVSAIAEEKQEAIKFDMELKTAVRRSLSDFNSQAEKTCRGLTNDVSATIRRVTSEANDNLRTVAKEACDKVQKASEVMENILQQMNDAKSEAILQWREIAKDASVSSSNCRKEVEQAGSLAKGDILLTSDESTSKVEEAGKKAIGSILSATDEAVSKISSFAEKSLLKLKEDSHKLVLPSSISTKPKASTSTSDFQTSFSSAQEHTSQSGPNLKNYKLSLNASSKMSDPAAAEETDYLGEPVYVNDSDSDFEDKSVQAASSTKSHSLADVRKAMTFGKDFVKVKRDSVVAKYGKRSGRNILNSEDEENSDADDNGPLTLNKLKKMKKDDIMDMVLKEQENGKKFSK